MDKVGRTVAERPPEHVLAGWTQEMACAHFGEPFDGEVVWATRLHYRAGDYWPGSHRIRLSAPYYDRYGEAETRATILHELCHWWLDRQGVRHRENSRAFQDLLRAKGAPRHAHPLEARHHYRCPACGRLYAYRRRVRGYACGTCCRRYAAGRYDSRFALVRVEPGPAAVG